MKKILLFFILFLTTICVSACNIPNENTVQTDTIKTMKLKITAGDKILTATMIDNVTTRAFMKMLPLILKMTELHNNEKYCNLPEQLPGKAVKPGTIHAGDLMLWDANYKCLVLFYKTFKSPYSYVKLGTIDNLDELEATLGSGDIELRFEKMD
ncbi:MAG: cyclophilin-like fold protein [Ignavibacterium sp.]|jgi:hypothetical protein|nr:cyclophilin-like fold protein [Ignavibacterium sp.]